VNGKLVAPEETAMGHMVAAKNPKDGQVSIFTTKRNKTSVSNFVAADSPLEISYDGWLVEYVKKKYPDVANAINTRKNKKSVPKILVHHETSFD